MDETTYWPLAMIMAAGCAFVLGLIMSPDSRFARWIERSVDIVAAPVYWVMHRVSRRG